MSCYARGVQELEQEPVQADEARPGRATWITEGLVLASLSAVAYLVPFAYELGYCATFSIPWDFIQLDLTQVLLAFFGLLAAAVFLFPIVDFACSMALRSMTVPPRWHHLVVFAVVATVCFWSADAGVWSWVFLSVALVVLCLIVALAAHHGARFLPSLVVLRQRAGPGSVWLLAWLLLALAVAYLTGQKVAASREGFLVTQTWPELVVLRIYGDRIVAAPFDAEHKVVFQSFRILTVSDDDLDLAGRSIGPLRMVGGQTPPPQPTTRP